MRSDRELKASVSREIFRVQAKIDKEIGSASTTAKQRKRLRSAIFKLIELEESISTGSVIAWKSTLSSFNKYIEDKALQIAPRIEIFEKDQSEQFKLTKKEIEVLRLLPEGMSIRDMAAHLYLTESTIKSHLTSIYRKLSVTNRVQAIAKARKNRI